MGEKWHSSRIYQNMNEESTTQMTRKLKKKQTGLDSQVFAVNSTSIERVIPGILQENYWGTWE